MSDFESKINGILSDPEALSGIINAVKGLGLVQPSQNTSQVFPKTDPHGLIPERNATDTLSAMGKAFNEDKESIVSSKSIGLLLALRPFLSAEKRDKIDVITKLLRIATLTELLK